MREEKRKINQCLYSWKKPQHSSYTALKSIHIIYFYRLKHPKWCQLTELLSKSSFLINNVCMSLMPAQSELTTLPKSLHTDEFTNVQVYWSCYHRDSKPTCFNNNPFALCVCACMSVYLCAYKCRYIVYLKDYTGMEQEQLKKEIKGNKRTSSFDI